MDNFFRNQDDMASLGIVFFSNAFIRELDSFRITHSRSEQFIALCDEAITCLQSLLHHEPTTARPEGLLNNADEIAALASSLARHFQVHTPKEAQDTVDRIIKIIARIKTQKDHTNELDTKINDILVFFEYVAEEGLANSRKQSSGDTTEAERVWQHYAMS